MTERISFNIDSYRIFLGQTLIDDAQSSDRDDFRPGGDFYITLGVSERPGTDTQFRAHWRPLNRFTLYFGAVGLVGQRSPGAVIREWRANARLLTDASTLVEREMFGPMREWLATEPSLRMALFGENRNLDMARFRIYGDTQRF